MKKRLFLVLAVLTGMFLLSVSTVSAQSRFIDNGDGTVTDTKTQLMWVKYADLFGGQNWDEASNYVNNFILGTSCGTPLSDWRLPNQWELQSLLDLGNYNPALPTGHPFTDVSATPYWTSTSHWNNGVEDMAIYVPMYNAGVGYAHKSDPFSVWPVRNAN